MIIGIDASRAFGSGKTGTEYYSYHLIKHLISLPESREQDFVLFIRPNTVLPSWIKKKNVQIKIIKLRYLWTQLGLAWETYSKLKIDVLWVPAHTLPVLGRPSLKTVVTIHGLEYQWLPEYRNWLQKWYLPLSTYFAAKRSTQLIAVSKFTRDQLVKELHISAKKIKVIHEGVESKVTKGNKIDLKRYILFVGTVQPRKNLVSLIEAFALVVKEIPDLMLVIAGGIGWMAEDVLRAPSRLNIQDKVIFTGRVSEETLSGLYGSCLVYVQPSWTEGFGLPVLEAMESGAPVISSSGGALPEVVGDDGIVVQLNKDFVANLAKQITGLVINKKARASYIAKGKKRVRVFTWAKAAKSTLKLLLDL